MLRKKSEKMLCIFSSRVCIANSRYPGFRYRSSRFPRSAQSSGHLWCPYYPCHGL
ncbi:MAG: hypothetical protein PUJ82_13465 [Spirochaetales bacterium]|nr:hypothetical protein [Spirochaetales bacterium]